MGMGYRYRYVEGDIWELVYSAWEGQWVKSMAMDVMKGTLMGIWERVCRSQAAQATRHWEFKRGFAV